MFQQAIQFFRVALGLMFNGFLKFGFDMAVCYFHSAPLLGLVYEWRGYSHCGKTSIAPCVASCNRADAVRLLVRNFQCLQIRNLKSLMPRESMSGPPAVSYADWKGVVYPTHREKGFHEATFLAVFFDTIEINTSFYQPLKPNLAAQWLERIAANPRFLFTAKLWQKFTHEGGTTAEDAKIVHAGFDILRDANRLGAVLLQFPFSFHNTPETQARLNQILDEFRDYPLVVEVRHSSWARKEFYELLHGRGVGFCNIDQPVDRPLDQTERARHFADRLRAAARPALRHLVQRRSGIAAVGTLQLSLFGRGAGAVGQAGRTRGGKRAGHVRCHQQSF